MQGYFILGMTEPNAKILVGKKEVKVLDDGWTAVTKDKKLSAQYEHTVAVTASGYEVFTLSKEEKLLSR